MATTPPPRGRLHTPPAPVHGPRYDDYDPYSPPRRSSRVAAQHQQLHAPSSSFSRYDRAVTPPSKTSSQAFSPPVSPLPKALPGDLEDEEAVAQRVDYLAARFPHAMLPTPVKSPRKRGAQSKDELKSTARVLFADRAPTAEEAMPNPKRSRKNKGVHSLDSFEENAQYQEIKIYADPDARVPDMEEDEDNPFISKGAEKLRQNGRDAVPMRHPDPQVAQMEEAAANGEGLLYVFRGRKMLRKFTDQPPSDPETSDHETKRRVGIAARRITRASIKPRRLWHNSQGQNAARGGQTVATNEEEEAPTDIEEAVSTPRRGRRGVVAAPEAPVDVEVPVSPPARKTRHSEATVSTKPVVAITPATPPSTRRTKRFRDAEDSETEHFTAEELNSPPAANTRGKSHARHAFEVWRRKKSNSSDSNPPSKQAHSNPPSKRGKRAGTHLESAPKRTKSAPASD